MRSSVKLIVILLAFTFLLLKVDAFSKFIYMDSEKDCPSGGNFITSSNGDDELFIKAWSDGGWGWRNPLPQGCEISFLPYGLNGITNYFLGNASKNYIQSEGVRLQIYNDIIGDGKPAVEYKLDSSFPFKYQLLKDDGFLVRLINPSEHSNFDFTLHVSATDDITADFEAHKNDSTIILVACSTVGGVFCIGVIAFVVIFYKRSKRLRGQQLTGQAATVSAGRTATGFDNFMYGSAPFVYQPQTQTAVPVQAEALQDNPALAKNTSS